MELKKNEAQESRSSMEIWNSAKSRSAGWGPTLAVPPQPPPPPSSQGDEPSRSAPTDEKGAKPGNPTPFPHSSIQGNTVSVRLPKTKLELQRIDLSRGLWQAGLSTSTVCTQRGQLSTSGSRSAPLCRPPVSWLPLHPGAWPSTRLCPWPWA